MYFSDFSSKRSQTWLSLWTTDHLRSSANIFYLVLGPHSFLKWRIIWRKVFFYVSRQTARCYLPRILSLMNIAIFSPWSINLRILGINRRKAILYLCSSLVSQIPKNKQTISNHTNALCVTGACRYTPGICFCVSYFGCWASFCSWLFFCHSVILPSFSLVSGS